MRRFVLAAVAALALAPAAFADAFQPAEVLVYTRWKYVWDAKAGVATPRGAYHHVSTEVGAVSVTLDGTSTWTLTGDSYVTAFNGDASCVISNGYTLYVNGVALTGVK